MKNIAIIILITLISLPLYSQEWKVPANKAKRVSPFKFEQSTVKAGEEIYNKNCKSCHGDPTQGNFIPLNPVPTDLGVESVQNQKDGELFFKIKEGRGAMPSFKDALSDNEKWTVIAFIRSFNKNYIQPELQKASEAFKGEMVFLNVLFDKNEKKIIAKVTGLKKGDTVNVSGVAVKLGVERYFGNLNIGELVETDEEGNAIFELPKDLPGDHEGNLQFITKLEDTDTYGEVVIESKFQAGVPTHKPGLTEKRAIWGVNAKAPWWILITYPVGLLAVLGTIAYVVFQIYKIYRIGNK